MNRFDKRKSYKKKVILIFLLLIALGAAYVYNSDLFEQQKPTIQTEDVIYWNLKTPIPITFKDSSGIKFLRVTLKGQNSNIVLENKIYDNPQKELSLKISDPRSMFLGDKKDVILNIQATDNSYWNFFMGNKSEKNVLIHVDKKRPDLFILANSYSITKGGSASVVFSANDENLQNLYIKTSSGDIFTPTPFYKSGYYISLVAWRHNAKQFVADVIATDKAGNSTRRRVKYYLMGKKYRTSNIKATDRFINGKISTLTEQYTPDGGYDMSKKEKFQFINETLRKSNEKKIKESTSASTDRLVSDFNIEPFYPLKSAALVASFGDHRFYYYKRKPISESYHLGIDLASVKEADIVSSNDGKVVFAQENGIYGNNLIISHGLGLYSLYGHCSTIYTPFDARVKKGEVVAKTGVSGLALGDHLHFGILVQGMEVRPEEWMDKQWIKNNITSVIEKSKAIIDKK